MLRQLVLSEVKIDYRNRRKVLYLDQFWKCTVEIFNTLFKISFTVFRDSPCFIEDKTLRKSKIRLIGYFHFCGRNQEVCDIVLPQLLVAVNELLEKTVKLTTQIRSKLTTSFGVN